MLITAKKSNLYPIGYGRLISSYDLMIRITMLNYITNYDKCQVIR